MKIIRNDYLYDLLFYCSYKEKKPLRNSYKESQRDLFVLFSAFKENRTVSDAASDDSHTQKICASVSFKQVQNNTASYGPRA